MAITKEVGFRNLKRNIEGVISRIQDMVKIYFPQYLYSPSINKSLDVIKSSSFICLRKGMIMYAIIHE